MKSGGPWNLKGLRPEAREAARNAARQSGMSVGEWLNSVIQQDDDKYDEPMRGADYDEDDDGWRDDIRPEPYQEPYPEPYQEPRRESHRESHREPHRDDRSAQRRRGARADHREPPRRPRRERDVELEREAALAHEEFGEVHARLDRLTQQLERMARATVPRLTGAPAPQYGMRAPPPPTPPMRPNGHHVSNGVASLSVDDAVAEIAERQRALDAASAPAAPAASFASAAPATPFAPAAPAATVAPLAESEAAAPPPPLTPRQPEAPETRIDISKLEEQLRYITTRIEALRPSGDLEKVIGSFRKDLADIRDQLTEALPRRAVESLEIEVQALAKRLDHSRESGVDLGVLAGLERGLGEVRDALHGLTPAENLVGFDEAVRMLAQKVDLIIAKEDPAALQQLETAIAALRGIVSHVASNDTLTKVAEDVRALAAKVDGVANSAASGQAFSALESRIDSLANALNASAEAGHAVPRELEKLLSGLIEKLEWVQLTHTDHAALGSLEDRIAELIKRLDSSAAQLGNLEAVERGLADLLVRIDQFRTGESAPTADALHKPLAVDDIERDVAEIKRSERRTQESLEAVHGAVEHVVDRLAMIESGLHDGVAKAPAPELPQAEAETVPAAAPVAPAAVAIPAPAIAEPPARRAGAQRPPIDPNLPPDHPLEPGSAAGARATPSAAERIAASEAAVALAKPPVTAESGEKPNFIAAARRAAQAAAASPSERHIRTEAAAMRGTQSAKPSRLRKMLVAGGAVLIAVLCVHIALRMFQDRTIQNSAPGAAVAPQAPTHQAAPPQAAPELDSSKAAPQSGPLVLPVPGAPSETAPSAPDNAAPEAAPGVKPIAAPPAGTERQSSLDNAADITGSLPRRPPPPSIAPAQPAAAPAPAMGIEKLPATIGGPKLRAAAIAGDAAAEFEVATRFAEGHGVAPSDADAVRWLELAAKQGLAPAQFRLGGFYEKGVVVKKNLAAARDLYAAAAAKGNAKAMHNLAVLYAEGVNGPADYRTAAQWFRKAADRGIRDSQYNLAILYARGVGVEQNYTESYKWFALAADKGDSEAAKKRDEVAGYLDAQALAAAKLAVQKWSAEPQPADAIDIKAPPGGWDLPERAATSKPRSSGTKPATLN